MLLTISTTHSPATDLGYLVHKSPGRVHSVELPFGVAYVFYPEASAERCTMALLVEVDPIGLVRRRKSTRGGAGPLRQYVNDRPYAVSSFLSTAISRVLGTALGGRSRSKQDLAETAIALEARLHALPCRGGEAFLRGLFEPLGYTVAADPIVLDPFFPEWGDSRYFNVTLTAARRLRDLLTHLYVLVPVLDDDKHYWVGSDEVDKLLKKGDGWLESHPQREMIVSRYLRGRSRLIREALERLLEADAAPDEVEEGVEAPPEEAFERPISLNEQRLGSVTAALRAAGARRIVDLGCGEGRLLTRLARDAAVERVLGMDVSYRAVETARSGVERLPEHARRRAEVIHASLLYRDARLEGFDAAALVEVIEHIEPARLPVVERNIFEFARPGTVVVTTPNVEYNVRFPGMEAGARRHPDHRFEWTREDFRRWTAHVGGSFGYRVRLVPVGPEDSEVGSPTQMAVFER